MTAPVAGQERDLAALQRAQDISVGRLAERGVQTDFLYPGQAGHGVQPAATDDSDFRLRQGSSQVKRCVTEG